MCYQGVNSPPSTCKVGPAALLVFTQNHSNVILNVKTVTSPELNMEF